MTEVTSNNLTALGSIYRSLALVAACSAVFASFCAADWKDLFRSLPEKAEQAYKQENYEKALQLYQEAQTRNPDSDTLSYNLGNTLYKLGRYQDAAQQFGHVLEKDSAAIAPRAIYNMGNSLYNMGRESQNQEFLKQALKAFKHSIISDPADEDSKYNYELTSRLIQEQEQQQQQQDQDQQDQNQDQNQEQKQEQQQQQNQEQQEQQEQQQEQQQQQQAEQPEQQPQPGEMSEQEAEKILQALIQMEKEAREQDKNKQPVSGSKGRDW